MSGREYGRPRAIGKCGCKGDHYRWLELCPAHQAETDARHQQAQADYRARRQDLEALAPPAMSA